jgi:hypothetical protein
MPNSPCSITSSWTGVIVVPFYVPFALFSSSTTIRVIIAADLLHRPTLPTIVILFLSCHTFITHPFDSVSNRFRLVSLTAKLIFTWMAHIVEQQHYISHVYYAIRSWARRHIPTPFTAKLVFTGMTNIVEQ